MTGSPKKISGFTLVEMIVALAIFSVVAVVAVGALVKVVNANRKAQIVQSSVSNIGFVLESMVREIRTGTNYDCEDSNIMGWNLAGNTLPTSRACGGASGNPIGHLIAFISSRIDTTSNNCPLVTVYRFNSAENQIEKAVQQHCSDNIDPITSFSPVTSTSTYTEISSFDLTVNPDWKNFSSAFIRITGISGTREQDKTPFDVQTYVSQRVQDL